MKEKVFGAILFFAIFLQTFATPTYAQTVPWTQREGLKCTGIGLLNKEGEDVGKDVATIQGFGCLIANILSVAITVIGLAAFVMFIYASFKWMLAGSNSKNVETARSTFTYGVIGLVVAVSSFIILNLISNFTGITVTNFVIPG